MSNSLFEYKVRARHRLGWKEFSFYATTEIEEFLNRNSIEYVRNMTDTVEHRLLKEIDKLVDTNEDINREFSRYKYESKKEIEKLNNNIDKAIEYMNEVLECNYHGGNVTFDALVHNTEHILKGSEK